MAVAIVLEDWVVSKITTLTVFGCSLPSIYGEFEGLNSGLHKMITAELRRTTVNDPTPSEDNETVGLTRATISDSVVLPDTQLWNHGT